MKKIIMMAVIIAIITLGYIFVFSENHQTYINCIKLSIHPDKIYYNTEMKLEDLINYKDDIQDPVSVSLITKRKDNEKTLREFMEEKGFELLEVERFDEGERLMQIFQKNGMVFRIHRYYYGNNYVIYFTDNLGYMSIDEWGKLNEEGN